jgi:hypothetical protein
MKSLPLSKVYQLLDAGPVVTDDYHVLENALMRQPLGTAAHPGPDLVE